MRGADSAQQPTRLLKHFDGYISAIKPLMPSISHPPCSPDSGQLLLPTHSRTFASSKPTCLVFVELPASWNGYDLILSTSMLEHLPKKELPSALSSLRSRLAQNGALLVVITRKNFMTKFLIEWWWHARRYSHRDLQEAFAAAGFGTVGFRRFPLRYFWLNTANYVVVGSVGADAA
jgi:methyltransferase family protein